MPWRESYRTRDGRARSAKEAQGLPGWVIQLVASLFILALVLGAARSPTGPASSVVEFARGVVGEDLSYEEVTLWAGGAATAVGRFFNLDLRGFWSEAVTGRPAEPSWPVLGQITSTFGWRSSPDSAGMSLHQGIDIQVLSGTKVTAILPGAVSLVRESPAYGLVVEVNHGNGLVSRYARLNSASVTEGNRVKKGEELGVVGKGGDSTLLHLHFEVAKDGLEIDPLTVLPSVSKGP